MNRLFIIIFIFAFSFFSCTSNEIGYSKDVNPETIYFHYRVWGDEESGIVTVKLQYRFGGLNGTSLLLDTPSKVEFDDEVIPADSSVFSGAYYEVIRPLDEFGGKHSIVFTGMNEKKYREEFDYPVISLKTQLPDTLKRQDIIFEVAGLKSNDMIRLLLTDTSFYNRCIERIDTLKDGRIIITKEELKNLVNGPVHLELSREEEKVPAEGTKEGGIFSISYGLKREFILKD